MRFKTRSGRVLLGSMLLLLVLVPLPGRGGMDVMTNQEMGILEGGKVVELSISEDDFYNSTTDVTVVRFASDIYMENYGEIGAIKMGDYPRSWVELGDMASMDSNLTMVFGPQNRQNPNGGGVEVETGFTGTGAGDDPYMSNTNRTDRIHDRYAGGGSSRVSLGQAAYLHSVAPYDYFGSSLCSNYPETQWDINWEALQVGVSENFPLRMYGLVLRAEFDNWGTSRQQLRRFVIGSNTLYGYSQARPLICSGWLNSEMARLNDEVYAVGINEACFQVQRDPIMDAYWSLSSFAFNPDSAGADGSFRQFWFNTEMSDITISAGDTNRVANFVDKNHGFFLMIDMTDRRFSGWNLIGGVNEYRDWPPLEQDDDHYFENEYRSD